ncbi:uncharacterized protein LOC123888993 [Trifolium pratense]|uniref:uncharacterized protein LOC123888993 n=1 Tax=Trifolium pratense TaxID=57577 RepID=UPI001E69776E|nr:uncharacterized protein LOC123888993 [Trifolium pratense]
MDKMDCVLGRDLYFDIINVLGSEKELLETGYLIDCLHRSTIERRVNLDMCRDVFVKRVDQFVKDFQGPKIDSLIVNFHLDCEQSNTIDQWIQFAIVKGVERIDLLFLGRPYVHRTSRKKHYKFEFGLFSETNASTVKHLRLQYCLVCHPINYDFIPLKNLRSLSLENTKLDEMFIESLLSNCRQLEELCLIFCEFNSSMPKIVSSSLCRLKVQMCYFVSNIYQINVNLILVDCLKLTSLEYIGRGLDTLNFNTPTLKSIDFFTSLKDLDAFVTLCATFPELEILNVNIFFKVTTSLTITQPLKHLKQLDIVVLCAFILPNAECDLLWILNILQASPLLQKLSIMVADPEFSKNQKDIRDVEIFSHDEIKIIELRGCVGNWYEIEFIMNVLNYAHKLEQIVVSPYWRESDTLDWKSNPVWFQSGRKKMSELLLDEKMIGREKLVLM